MREPLRLSAGDASAVVDSERGGVVASLSVRGRDLLLPPTEAWQPYPRWGSFLIAPWVGPLSDGRLPFQGRVYRLSPNEGRHANHGLVAGLPWEVKDASDGAVTLARGLGGVWPFGGAVRQQIRLLADSITLAVEIGADDLPMPAAAGWHPWFRRGARATSVQVSADRELRHEGVLPTGEIDEVVGDTDLRSYPSLGDRRIDAAYVGARSPAIFSADAIELRIEFAAEIDTVVVFTPEDAVCVEPWSAWPDANRLAQLGHATGLVELKPHQVLRRWTRWTWTDRSS